MSDLIDRRAAIRWVKTECNPYGKPTIDFESGKKVIEHLEQMPFAEPERKMGKWLIEYLYGIPGRRAEIKYCSECCQVSPYRHKFCPNCGADMSGE